MLGHNEKIKANDAARHSICEDVAADQIKARGRTPFWKVYIAVWVAGTIGLSYEQKGFLFEILMRMWDRKGGMRNDIEWIARALQCDRRVVKRLLPTLIAEGKLRVDGDLLVNDRVMRDLDAYTLRQTSEELPAEVSEKSARSLAEVRRKSGETFQKTQQNQDHLAHSQKPEARPQNPEELAASRETQTAQDDRLAGLNGSASRMLNDIVGWMGPQGEIESARNWLTTQLGLYTDQIVVDGYGKLKTDMASGKAIRRPLVVWDAICQRKRDEASAAAAEANKPLKLRRY
jgi:uncharacterized protein YdaU (DUF1376 family)